MSNDNLKLWNDVQETNPADTKPVTFGRKFTAIDAYSQIKKATEKFGSYGVWGLKDIKHTFIEGTTMVMAVAQFEYATEDSKTESFPISSSILYISEKGKVDDDFAKKLETDMITKALSRLGFNADVFMGMFDDNRYVAQMNEKFKEKPPEVEFISEKQLNELQAMADLTGTDVEKLCQHYKITSLKQIPSEKFNAVMGALKNKLPSGEKS